MHASGVPEPVSPLQGEHLFVVASQIGALPMHCELSVHCSQSPMFGPVVAQIVERHTAAPFAPEQGPSPFLKPHELSGSHTPDTQARPPNTAVQAPPGTGIPFGTFGEQTPGATRSLHQSPATQSVSLVQEVPHVPVVALQIGPACVPVAQSRFVVHLAHAPEGAQNGLVPLLHASVAPEPRSPLQEAQVSEVASHTGLLPTQSVASLGVHWTHWFFVVSHAGVGDAQVESSTHASQRPLFAPLVAHTVERHTVVPFTPVHGPSPFLKPQRLSTSQTLLWHTSVPAGAVHEPFSVGFMCCGSVGITMPFGSCGAHACIASLHQVPAAQSASTLQPPIGEHVPFALHVPERHTVPPLPAVQGPSPVAKPHLLSVASQTPLMHTSAPAWAVQVLLSVGFICGPSVGISVPLETFGVHMWALSLHQLPPEQSASTLQPPEGAHVPLLLHFPERQTVPPFTIVQGPSPTA